jgi:hypothetical protein
LRLLLNAINLIFRRISEDPDYTCQSRLPQKLLAQPGGGHSNRCRMLATKNRITGPLHSQKEGTGSKRRVFSRITIKGRGVPLL